MMIMTQSVVVDGVTEVNYFTIFVVTVLPSFIFITFRITPLALLPTSMPAVLKYRVDAMSSVLDTSLMLVSPLATASSPRPPISLAARTE